jgi:DNA-binding transcriptional LysR family regulator
MAQALLMERSVTRAAARLHLSVPATSRALERCRVAFADPLLIRSGRRLEITPRGSELLSELTAALAAVDHAVRPAAAFDPQQLRAAFTVRANEVITAAIAGVWLEVLNEQAPAVRLRFVSESEEDVDALRRGDADLAIGSYSGLTNDVHHSVLVDEQLIGVVRADHPCVRARITPRRFADLRHVAVSRRGIAHGPVDALLAERGLRRDVCAVVPSFAAAVGMCVASDLTTLAPASLVRVLASPSTLATFKPPLDLPVVRVEVAWHARHQQDPSHRWLIATLMEAVERYRSSGRGV